MSADQPSPKRSFLRFSVRNLLVLTAIVAAFFWGRVSMQPELAKRKQIIKENELAAQQHLQVMMNHYEAQLKAGKEPNELERFFLESDVGRQMRRHSAGNGQYFLGPIPAVK